MIYACRYNADNVGIWILESDLVSHFVSINPLTLFKALSFPTLYLPHGPAVILPSVESCLWDKWDNTFKALKTVSGLFVWVTKWVSKTVNKKISCLWHAGKQAFISIPGPIWLLTLQCISFIHVCSLLAFFFPFLSCFFLSFFFFPSEQLVSALGPSWTSDGFLLIQAGFIIVLPEENSFLSSK